MYDWGRDINVSDIGTVGVLYGGWSNERSVSLESGVCVLNALKRININAIGFDIVNYADIFKLKDYGLDVIIIALHGGDGEDGHVQAALDLMDLKYIGSGLTASALCMNKVRARMICKAAGVPVVPWQDFEASEPPLKPDFDFPVCLKPVAGGSSIGVEKVVDIEQWRKVTSNLAPGAWMVEPWINGVDHFVGIIGDVVLPVIEVALPEGEFFDFNNKYVAANKKNIVIDKPDLQQRMRTAFDALGCRHYARADFITVGARSWFLEMNTAPGMVPTCLLPQQAKFSGLAYEDLLLHLVSMAEDKEEVCA